MTARAFPKRERGTIFDRGARLDTGKPGTGLGLAIVRDVAQIYGGSDRARGKRGSGRPARAAHPAAARGEPAAIVDDRADQGQGDRHVEMEAPLGLIFAGRPRGIRKRGIGSGPSHQRAKCMVRPSTSRRSAKPKRIGPKRSVSRPPSLRQPARKGGAAEIAPPGFDAVLLAHPDRDRHFGRGGGKAHDPRRAAAPTSPLPRITSAMPDGREIAIDQVERADRGRQAGEILAHHARIERRRPPPPRSRWRWRKARRRARTPPGRGFRPRCARPARGRRASPPAAARQGSESTARRPARRAPSRCGGPRSRPASLSAPPASPSARRRSSRARAAPRPSPASAAAGSPASASAPASSAATGRHSRRRARCPARNRTAGRPGIELGKQDQIGHVANRDAPPQRRARRRRGRRSCPSPASHDACRHGLAAPEPHRLADIGKDRARHRDAARGPVARAQRGVDRARPGRGRRRAGRTTALLKAGRLLAPGNDDDARPPAPPRRARRCRETKSRPSARSR